MTASPAPSPPVEERRRRRRQGRVVAGLLLTFGGLFLAAASLPTAGAALDRGILLVGGALLAVWVGGLLMGRFSGGRAG